jgi:hypothetical protein
MWKVPKKKTRKSPSDKQESLITCVEASGEAGAGAL